MKKSLSVVLVAVMLTAVLAGCGNGGYKDGTYKASFKDFDDHGWKGFVEVVITDGKISDAKFDYENEEGALKSEDDEYNKTMKDASGTSPEEFSPKLAEDLVEKQDVDKVDTVTGATHSVDDFKELAKAALKNAKAGNTEEVIVEQKAENE
ncbi:FMN-binding protein [Xylanivirga thermophila]|jgi:major membrane immunogen (membrane-anchored lipoprotein)|uniref:FMN-binding protein n=1 Tax=Xylanivirga thermophila TaxID=2496273 RepID=UPI00101E1848|nr:FMN-binding protein [Xylanivirga thermophila]